MNDDVIIGIDLGTTRSAVGVVDSGFAVLVPDEQGHRLTPSLLRFHSDGVLTVGHEAENVSTAHDKTTSTLIYSAKRLIGRRYSDIPAEEIADLAYAVVPDTEGMAALRLANGERIRPEAVASEILRKLKCDAETYLEREVRRCVISVPAYFNESQRQATKTAAERAGLNVERLIAEPTAAALAYGTDQEIKRGRVAVFDLGGGTFDVSILDINDGVFEVLATHGDTRLGGDDIDRQIVDWLRLQLENGDALDESVLRNAAVDAKHRLSDADSIEIEIISDSLPCPARVFLSREQLDSLARPVLERTRSICLQALHDAGLRCDQLDAVLLVGGQTRMPLVRQWVRDIFDRNPATNVNPDEAVALGATIQAGMLSGALQRMVLLDVTPLSLGIETFGGLMNVLIARNTGIPCKAGEVFTNAVDGQASMRITILQGERELAKDNWKLGEVVVPFAPAARGKARVGVQFSLDEDGLLHVLARDLSTGHEQQLQIDAAVRVDDEAVESMVAASIDHALTDMESRRSIEAWSKAERILSTTRQALTQVGDELPETQRELILESMAKLEALGQDGGGRAIKRAIEILDECSLPLADLLVGKALEAATLKAMSLSENS